MLKPFQWVSVEKFSVPMIKRELNGKYVGFPLGGYVKFVDDADPTSKADKNKLSENGFTQNQSFSVHLLFQQAPLQILF